MKYTVIRVGFGENASSLARKYKTTERSLFLLNDNPLFFEGERLIAAEFHGKSCVAKPFDTAETVAKRTGTRKEEVIRLNGTDKFFPGQNVILSDYDE